MKHIRIFATSAIMAAISFISPTILATNGPNYDYEASRWCRIAMESLDKFSFHAGQGSCHIRKDNTGKHKYNPAGYGGSITHASTGYPVPSKDFYCEVTCGDNSDNWFKLYLAPGPGKRHIDLKDHEWAANLLKCDLSGVRAKPGLCKVNACACLNHCTYHTQLKYDCKTAPNHEVWMNPANVAAP